MVSFTFIFCLRLFGVKIKNEKEHYTFVPIDVNYLMRVNINVRPIAYCFDLDYPKTSEY